MGKIVTEDGLSEILTSLKSYLGSNYTKSISLSPVATSGNYNDLSNTPAIPSKLSDLNNDSGFVNQTYVDEQISRMSARFLTNASSTAFITDVEFTTAVTNNGFYYAGEHITNVGVNDHTAILSDESMNTTLDVNYSNFVATAQYVGKYIQSQSKGSVLVTTANKDNAEALGLPGGIITNNGNNNTKAYISPCPMTQCYAERDSNQNIVWTKKYVLNNTSFNNAQWESINSSATSAKIFSYDSHIINDGIHLTADEKSWISEEMVDFYNRIFKTNWVCSASYTQSPSAENYNIDQYASASLTVNVTCTLDSVLSDASNTITGWGKTSTGKYSKTISAQTGSIASTAFIKYRTDSDVPAKYSSHCTENASKTISSYSISYNCPIWYGWVTTNPSSISSIFSLINTADPTVISFTKQYSDVLYQVGDLVNSFINSNAYFFVLTHGDASAVGATGNIFSTPSTDTYSFSNAWQNVSYKLYVSPICSDKISNIELNIHTK